MTIETAIFRYYERLARAEKEDDLLEAYCEQYNLPFPETWGERREMLNEIGDFLVDAVGEDYHG